MNVSIRVSLETANRLAALKACQSDTFELVIRRQLTRLSLPSGPAASLPVVLPRPVLAYGFHVRLGDERHSLATAKQATILILRYLARSGPEFWPRLSARAAKRCRNHLSSQRHLVYPGRPDLDHHILEIAPGWFLGTNTNTWEKRKLIRLACEVAGVEFAANVHCDLSRKKLDLG